MTEVADANKRSTNASDAERHMTVDQFYDRYFPQLNGGSSGGSSGSVDSAGFALPAAHAEFADGERRRRTGDVFSEIGSGIQRAIRQATEKGS